MIVIMILIIILNIIFIMLIIVIWQEKVTCRQSFDAHHLMQTKIIDMKDSKQREC